MKRFTALIAALVMSLGISSAHAAFIVEADNVAPAGKANGNFSSLPAGTGFSLTTTFSSAAGTQANQSAFGNPANGTGPDQYTFRYTPGTDVDNTVYAAGLVIGNSEATDADGLGPIAPTYTNVNQTATGLVGGATGLYNVYFTTPTSTNVSTTGSQFVISHDLGTTNLNPVNQNDGGTGPDTTPVGGAHVGGANNMWLKIASLVPMTAGTQYTVVMTANSPVFVSQRAHGMMWEYAGPSNLPPVVNPEPPEVGLTTQGDIITTTFTATDATALPVTFSNAVLSSFVPLIPGATNPTFNGVVDPAGNFTWDTTGFARGVYTIDVTATDSGTPPLAGTGGAFVVTIEEVPEPTSLALCGLAIVGLLGCNRRRDGQA